MKSLFLSLVFLLSFGTGYAIVHSWEVKEVYFEHDTSLGEIEPGLGYLTRARYVVEATRNGVGSVLVEGGVNITNPLSSWPSLVVATTTIYTNIINNKLHTQANDLLDELEDNQTVGEQEVTDDEINGLIGLELSITLP